MAEKEISIEIKNPGIIILLIFISVVFFFELQVTLNNLIVFGDEGYHARMAQHFAQEQHYPKWYPYTELEVRNDFARPTFYHLLQGSFLFLFGFNEVLIKFFVPFLSFVSGITIYILVKKLYNKEVAFLSSLIAVTLSSFVTYSVLVYTDILFTLYITLFFFLFTLAVKNRNKKYWIVSGVFGGLAILTKIPGLAIFLLIGVMFLYQLKKERKFLDLFKKYIFLILIIFLIIGPFMLRNLYYYSTPLCYDLPFFSKDGCKEEYYQREHETQQETEVVGTEQEVFRMGIMGYLEFAYGSIQYFPFGVLLWFPFWFLSGLILLYFKRREIDILILLILLTFGMFIVLRWNDFFWRAENTARFSLGWIAILSLVASIYLENIYSFLKKYQRYVALVIFIVVIILGFQNSMSKLDVMKDVKRFSPAFFEACDWIKGNLQENAVLDSLWDHRVVYNCQRLLSGHPDLRSSRDANYTLSVAKEANITHLFIQKFMIRSNEQEYGYSVDYVEFLEDNPKVFIKLYENGPPLQQCLQQGGCDGTIVYEINYSSL